MRPLALELAAFGPYPERQRLDFGALPRGTLFLVHGPTGSGKTTILDAIAFALYGDTSGAERAGGDMRCQLATQETLTEVTLDFELGDERYRVQRVPDQLRPKKRGEGLAEQKKEATLWRLGSGGDGGAGGGEEGEVSEGKPLATGWVKVTERVRELLGLDSGQFRQVVVLPQGQFRKLLLAASDEREAILERLFATDRFRELEALLRERARGLREEARELATRRAALIDEAAQDLGLRGEGVEDGGEVRDSGEADASDGPGESDGTDGTGESGDAQEPTGPPKREELDRARVALSERVEEAARDAKRAAEAAEDAAKALAAAEAAREALRALERARSREAELAAGAEEVERARGELEAARRAAELMPLVTARRRAVAAETQAASDLETARRAEDEAARALEGARKELARETGEEAASEREAATAEVARLEGLGDLVAKLEGARREATQRAKDAGAKEAAARAAGEAFEAREARRQAVAAQRDQAEQAAARVSELRAARDAARRVEKEAGELDVLRRDERAATTAAERAAAASTRSERAHSEARRECESVEQAFESGQAARLAEGLRDEEPCPVCGAREHPAPARPTEDAPSEADRERARAALDEAARTLDEARRIDADARARLEAAQRALAQQCERLGDDADVSLEEIKSRRERAEAELASAEEAAAACRSAREALAKLDEEIETARVARETAREAAAESRAAAGAAGETVAAREEEVPESLRSPGALDHALREARARRRALEERLESARDVEAKAKEAQARAVTRREGAERALADRRHELVEASEALDAALREAGLDDAEAVEAAARDVARRDALARRVSEHEKAKAAAHAETRRCEEAAKGVGATDAEGVDAPDAESVETPDAERVEALASARDAAADAREAATAAHATLAHREADARRTLERLDALDAKEAELERRHGALGRVAALSTGDNPRRLSLHRFVLAALLDQVLAVASVRLRRMSRGRYQLRRVDDARDGRRAAGLDLEVDDAYTGEARPVSTLSGGESFLAALALALSLAQVVQEHAGGVRLDALFVDEGFGSLDPDALELALSMLVELGEDGGRLVGVISHVGDLTERIPTRLEVTSDPRGSTARFVSG